AQALERRRGLRHLHQREDSLLHSRAARRRHDQERKPLRHAELDEPRQLLADHGGHAPAEEIELERRDGHGKPADATEPRDDRLLQPRLAAGSLQAVRILLRVLEFQRISRAKSGLSLLERALIGQGRDALAGADPEWVVALGTDAARTISLGAVDDLLAGFAL